jgi:hypothetical protein
MMRRIRVHALAVSLPLIPYTANASYLGVHCTSATNSQQRWMVNIGLSYLFAAATFKSCTLHGHISGEAFTMDRFHSTGQL